jgi:hypothetical protein
MGDPPSTTPQPPSGEKVHAGRLPAWDVGTLGPPPRIGWNPLLLIGPGLLMVGAAIGGGEWLMGPAATAKYGGAIMGLATLSILCQVVYNLEVMRYTVYCGEPVFIGFFRLLPGPRFWTVFYIFIDFFAIWPYLSASAAVPLHAVFLGRMPTPDESGTTQLISYGVFLAAFVPLIFGGKVYNTVEKMMTVKVILVLAYLLFLGVFFVSLGTWADVFGGFFFLGRGPEGDWAFRVPKPTSGEAVDWALLAGFAAIAGVGGLNNSQFSTYARDKGWGMGAAVGAIPSMVGGVGITLSHTGRVFPLTRESLQRWFGWMRYIRRDQWVIWAAGSFLGMAIPSLLSLEYLKGVNVPDKEVPAATAQAIAQHYPHLGFLWVATLLCGFIVLAPTQVTAMDGLIRRWTDVLWTASPYTRHMKGHQVKYIYYALLFAYLLFGMFVLWQLPNPLAMTKVSGVLLNFGLGFSAFHTLVVNRVLLPKELRPGPLRCAGLIGCGLFFIAISVMGFNRGMEDAGIYPWLRGLGLMQ